MEQHPNFQRSEEDIGNSVLLEHVNLRVPEQYTATLFYVSGLGLTREPYLVTGVENMWINVGRSQFHLGPHGEPQVLRGHVGLVMAERSALLQRLESVKERLVDTRFSFEEKEDHVAIVCPWGNRFRCYLPDVSRFGRYLLGVAYVELDVPLGTSEAIARFYQQALLVRAETRSDRNGHYAKVSIGVAQDLIFRESDRHQPQYDGHHIQMYINDFSGPHRWLSQRHLVSQEDNQHQYRFTNIIDPDDGRLLLVLEHEVRSMSHPLYGRQIVNRNPSQTNRAYVPGDDALQWQMPRGWHP